MNKPSTEPFPITGLSEDDIAAYFFAHDIALPGVETGFRAKFVQAVQDCAMQAVRKSRYHDTQRLHSMILNRLTVSTIEDGYLVSQVVESTRKNGKPQLVPLAANSVARVAIDEAAKTAAELSATTTKDV